MRKEGWRHYGYTVSETQVGADNLEWEKAKKFDIGIEGKLFRKIDFVIDYFHDRRDGIFQERKQVPEFVGLKQMPYGNVGSMVSYGFDGSGSYAHQFTKDLGFTVRANFTYSANKVNYFEEADTKYPYTTTTGIPYNYQRGYIALGLFRDQEELYNSPTQTFGTYQPGDIKYKDVNGDGIVNSDDKVPLSFSNYPRLQYGFGTEFRYKKWTLNIRFSGIGNTYFHRISGGYNSEKFKVETLTSSDDPTDASYGYRNYYDPDDKRFVLYYRYDNGNGWKEAREILTAE